jgi:hypothetical protein
LDITKSKFEIFPNGLQNEKENASFLQNGGQRRREVTIFWSEQKENKVRLTFDPLFIHPSS